MKQRARLAQALVGDPKLLLLDEPTSGLDPKASNEFSELLERVKDDGVAVLMATHDLFRSKEVGSRVGIMKAGTLVSTHAISDLSHSDLERVYLDHMHD